MANTNGGLKFCAKYYYFFSIFTQALFSGLAVMVPNDPWMFMEIKLEELKQQPPPLEISW